MESEVRGENTKVVDRNCRSRNSSNQGRVVGQLPYRWGQDPVVPKQRYTNDYVDNASVEERHCGSAAPDQKLKFGMHKPHFNIDRDVLILRQNDIFKSLDKTISSLEMESAASRASKAVEEEAFLEDAESGTKRLKEHPKVFFVNGVFYVLTVVDHNFMNHVEGYHELSSKTQIYFSTTIAKWDINLDYEWKAQAENPCFASFYWSCSGICKSVEKMMDVHQRCGEGG
ncbi:hypothetical protein V2J09_017995 [Rumex salicifolius]